MKRICLITVSALVAGCAHPAPAPVPTPTVSLARWAGAGDAVLPPVCNELEQYGCMLNYTLFNETKGITIANIPIGQLQYTIDSIQPDTYELWFNFQVSPGVVVTGAPAAATAKQAPAQ